MATKVKLIDNTISPTFAGASFTGDVNFEGGILQYDASSNSLDFQDNIYAQFGTSNDLRIYHNGTDSWIQEAGTGNLNIKANGPFINFLDNSNNLMAYMVPGGAVGLYHNTSKKFETSSAGATVTGTLTVTGDLDITGNVNSTSVTDLDVTDKTITLGVGQTEAQSGGSGIVIDGSGANLLWDESDNRWEFNKRLLTSSINLSPETTQYAVDASLSLYSSTNAVYLNGAGPNGWLRLNASGQANDRCAINLFGANQGDLITFKTNSTERMVISSGGNVGIAGNSNHAGNALAYGLTIDSAGFSGSGLEIHRTGNSRFELYQNSTGGQYLDALGSTPFMILATGGTERLRVTNTGIVDIGKSAFSSYPTGSQLNVYADGEGIRLDGTGNTTRRIRFRNVGAGTGPGEIIADGSLIIKNEDANAYLNLSSIRNIEYTVTSGNATAGHHIFNSYNTEIMRIDGANNRVGIGTGSGVDAKLHVQHSPKDNTTLKLENYLATANGAQYLNWQELKFSGNSGGTLEAGIRQYANGWQNGDTALAFWTSQHGGSYAERMRINGDGLVGIGTNDPHAMLHLKSTVASTGPSIILENTNNAQSMNIDYYNNAGSLQSRIQYAEGPSSFSFFTNTSQTAPLTINYTGYTTFTHHGNDYGMQIRSSGTTRSGIVIDHPGTSTIMGSVLVLANDNSYRLGTASYYHIRMMQNGQTFIGNTGSSEFTQYGDLVIDPGSNTNIALVVKGNNSTGGTVNWIADSNKGSNESHCHYGSNGDWYIRPASNSGTVYVKNYQAESDRRLKENVEDIEYGTTEILQLRPRKFNWIGESIEQNGFIAQEVESTIPAFVRTGEMKINDDDEEGIKSVDYNSIVAALVKTVQELEARIAELEG